MAHVRVLITGASGAVGGCLVPLLRARGWEVVALLRGGSQAANGQSGVQVVQGDLGDDFQVPVDHLDAAIHIAAEVPGAAIVNSPEKLATYQRVNDGGTRRVVEVAARLGASRIIYISSHAVPSHAENERSPLFAYASSKKRGEQHVMDSGLNWTIFRPTGIYGKGRYWRAYLRSFRERWVVRIYGDGSQVLQYVFEEDLARVLSDALENQKTFGKVYDVAGAPFTVDTYLRTIRRLTSSRFVILRCPLWVVRAAGRASAPISLALAERLRRIDESCRDEITDSSDLCRDTGFNPIPIEKGLAKILVDT